MRTLVLLTALALLSGCESTGWIQLTLESRELDIPEQLDGLRVELVASAERDTTESAEVCRAIERRLPEEGEELALPADVVIQRGLERSWSCVAVRLTGLLEGAEVLVVEDLFCPDFDTTAEETILLHGACHAGSSAPTCEEGEVCETSEGGDAECIGSPVGALFDIEPSFEEWCDGAI